VTDTAGAADIARPAGPRKTLADMGRSLGLMALVIVALLFLGPARALLFPGNDRMPAADYTSSLTGFARTAGVTPLAPTGLPASWRANAAGLHHTPSYDDLHIGWAVPGAHFAGLDEFTGQEHAAEVSVLGREVTSTTAVTIAGMQWQLGRSQRGETALIRQAGALVVVVTGDATDVQLRLLAGSLR
jgi:hypothetical protein